MRERFERSLMIIVQHSKNYSPKLFVKDNSVTIHIRNIQTLAIELSKVVNGISPEITSHVFPLKGAL